MVEIIFKIVYGKGIVLDQLYDRYHLSVLVLCLLTLVKQLTGVPLLSNLLLDVRYDPCYFQSG